MTRVLTLLFLLSCATVRGNVPQHSPALRSSLLSRLCLPNTSVQYGYDNIGQLKVADSSINTEDRGYACDAAWNIVYRTNNGACTSYSVNGLNEVTGDGTYSMSYDANGNIGTMYSSSSYLSFTFDDDNQLVCVYDALNSSFRTDFVYDGLGRLRSRLDYTNYIEEGRPGNVMLPDSWALASETLYIYDGNRVIQERDAYNTPTVSYTRGTNLSGTLDGAGGIGGLLARSAGGSHAYYHADGGGNITALADSSQTVVAAYRYDPFGNLISKSGGLADANVCRFSSKEFHPNTGLYYYGYRWYSPYLQRWINRDPAGENGGLNLYGFTANSPTVAMDSDGRFVVAAVNRWIGSQFDAFAQSTSNPMAGAAASLVSSLYSATAGFFDPMSQTWALAQNTAAVYASERTHCRVSAASAYIAGAYGLGSIFGFTGLAEGINGVDLASGDELSSTDSWSRGLAGGGTLLLWAAGGASYLDAPGAVAAAESTAPAFRTWNQFQAGTAGQFASRAEAAQAWAVYRDANAIVTGTTRSMAARSGYLRSLADNPNTASWMKPWLQEGRVPPGYEVDHIKPLSIGGPDTPANMRLQGADIHTIHHSKGRYRPWED